MGQNASAGGLEDKYFLQKVKLGQGSFGTVWRAIDRHNDRVVAIKQLDKAQLPKRGVKRQDIEREIAMMKASSHENLTQLFDTYEDEQYIYLALEYCDGGDFGDKVKERGMALTEKEVAEFMRQMCAGMNALHSKNVCHRDIKPDNFMVKTEAIGNMLKLTDFGLAIFVPPGKLLTEKCGTPAFMAPEQHRLPRESRGYAFPADVWAAGVSMFMVMFGGRHPFMNERGLDDRLLLGGVLDFREQPAQKFFGFDMGMGQLRFSDDCRKFCANMVCPDDRMRGSAEQLLQTSWLIRLGTQQQQGPGGQQATKQATQLAPSGGAFGGTDGPKPLPTSTRLTAENAVLKEQLAQQQAQMQDMQRRQSQQQQPVAMQPSQRPELARRDTKQIDVQAFQAANPPPRVGSPIDMGQLPHGVKCRYYSSSYGWMPARVQAVNESDGTYDLDVRQHAALDKISPMSSVSTAEAWPNGTLAQYHSTSVNKWLPATVQSFNEPEGTYNLDVRDHAEVDRIRARLSGVTGGGFTPTGAGASDGQQVDISRVNSQQPDIARHHTGLHNGYHGQQVQEERRPSVDSNNGGATKRDGSRAAPLMLADLAPAAGAAIGGLARSPGMAGVDAPPVDFQSAHPNATAVQSAVQAPAVWLSEGMKCDVVDVGPAEVVSLRGGLFDVMSVNQGRIQVPAEQIRAPSDPNYAWPIGMKVAYHSPSMREWINGTVQSFDTRECKYNLDVRQHAQADRVRPR